MYFDFQLGETIDILRNAISEFAKNEISPLASHIDKENQFPAELWKKLGALGVLGITVEEEYGGS